MKQHVRSSLVAAAIAVVIALVMGLVFQMGAGGTALFVLVMAAIAFGGSLVISTLVAQRHSGAPPAA